MAQTTPQQRSDLARKAAQARWSRTNPNADVGAGLKLNEEVQPACPDPNGSLPQPRPANRQKRPANRADWTSTRFCLRLEQDTAGVWYLLTPAGLRLPASPAEISLWLDLLALKSAQSVPQIC